MRDGRPPVRPFPLGRSGLAGALFGIGTAAFVDEVVFHQLLHWHHFYDRSTSAAGLVSDGILHAFSWFATVGSLVLIARLRRRGVLDGRVVAAAGCLGAGGFQLYDEIVDHKLLRVHQIRYGVHLLPYDLAWAASAAVLLAAGIVLLVRARRATA